jgi:hypothetical protein
MVTKVDEYLFKSMALLAPGLSMCVATHCENLFAVVYLSPNVFVIRKHSMKVIINTK